MSYFLYQLCFDGPVHFGDTSLGGGLEQAGWTYTSDTLFSSICTELAGQGEYKLLDDFVRLALEGELLLSDLFPYQLADGDEPQLFLPVPFIYLENNRKHVSLTLEEAKILSARRKKSKKQLYCRVSELQPYCDSLRAGMQYEPAAVIELGNEFITTKVNCPCRILSREMFSSLVLVCILLPDCLTILVKCFKIYCALWGCLGLAASAAAALAGFICRMMGWSWRMPMTGILIQRHCILC